MLVSYLLGLAVVLIVAVLAWLLQGAPTDGSHQPIVAIAAISSVVITIVYLVLLLL